MIEEAVGVSVFENKKKQNILKIERCDKSLEEIHTIIEESIKPKLNQLKTEELYLNEYRNISGKYEQMNKIGIAYKYIQDKMLVEKADVSIESNCSIIKEIEDENVKLNKDSSKLLKQVEQLQIKLDRDSGGDLKKFETDLNQKREKLEHIITKLKLKQENYNNEQTEMKKLMKMLDSKNLVQKKAELTELETKLEKLQEENQNDKQMLQKAQKDFEAILSGKSKGLEDEEASTLSQQMMANKEMLAEIVSKINKSELQIQHFKSELSLKKKKIKTDKDAYDKCNLEIQIKNKEIESIEKELESIDFNEKQFEEAKCKLDNLNKEYHRLVDKLNRDRSSVPGCEFKCPYPDIDQDKILGVVCDLFSVKSPDYFLAVEKACGSRLFNVVVTDEKIGSAIIAKKLKERRTFLPLNKITGRDADLKALRVAERLVGKGNVHYAINLVTFDPSLQNAMKYVFGDTMVCPNMDMAKKVAFCNEIMKPTVTYDGELFDPSGTLTGGAMKSGQKTLAIIQNIRSDMENLKCHRIAIQQFEEEYNKFNSIKKQYYDQKSKKDLKLNEIKYLNQRLEECSYYVWLKEIEDMEAENQKELLNIEQYKQEKLIALNRVKELENKIKNSNKTKEQEQMEAKQYLEEMKKKLANSNKLLQKEESNLRTFNVEFKKLQESSDNIQKQLEKISGEIVDIQKNIKELNDEIEVNKKQVEMAERRYNECKQELNKRSNEIIELQRELNAIKNKIHENSLEIKKKLFEQTKVQTSVKEAKDRIKHLLHKYSWIKEEEKHFHSTTNEYRVLNQNFNEQEFFQQLQQLKSKMETLSKSVNMRANIMHGEKLKEFEELMKKKENTLKDKKKLMKYIENVENKKDDELRNAWEKINVTFGSIFATLLPNSNAKLVPVKNNSIRDGLKIKVSFGDNWKEDLAELSGGQRSLVALSLVLALLKYNPAPLYILDEVDAALDQSHTQNIGIMIRTHFQNAQVII